jgi:hypothetical protein
MRHGSTQTLVYVAVWFVSITAAAAPTAVAQRTGKAVGCTAQSTAAGLEVHCPSATVGDFLYVLQQATGLRSEYPQELAPTRVSVIVHRSSLVEVLENALSAFNFALWSDQSSPSVTWVKILEVRGTVERPDYSQPYHQTQPSPELEPASTLSELRPGSTASLPASDNEAQMAEVRESFARSVTSANEIEPIPIVTSPVIMPGVDLQPEAR